MKTLPPPLKWRKLRTCLLVLIVFPFSCDDSQQKIPERIADFVDPAFVITDADKLKAERIHTVTKVLREIYKNREVVEEVNAAVATGYYVDETIMLKDLLNPETSPVYQTESFKESVRARGVPPGLFKASFEKALGITNARQNDDYFYEGDVYIYFPYSEQTSGYNQIPVVVPATVEADEAWAYQPYGPDPDIINPPGHMTLVNDSYAEMYQTHIVGVADVESNPQYAYQGCQATFLSVYVGYVKVYYRQYDAFISYTGNGGGAEIRIALARGSQDGSTVAKFEKYIEVYVPRGKARHAEWVLSWEQIEASWGSNYPRLLFAVYEKDNTSQTTNFSGTLEYINSAGQTITSNYSINVRTKNARISEDRLLRDYLLSEYLKFGHLQPYVLGYAPAWRGNFDYATMYSLPGMCFN